jgi:hypothetical protein
MTGDEIEEGDNQESAASIQPGFTATSSEMFLLSKNIYQMDISICKCRFILMNRITDDGIDYIPFKITE